MYHGLSQPLEVFLLVRVDEGGPSSNGIISIDIGAPFLEYLRFGRTGLEMPNQELNLVMKTWF